MNIRILVLTLVSLTSWPALADSLDGDWCNPEDGKLTIEGNTIITPSGNALAGEYGRHRFVYIAPEGDWNGGKRIVIQQFSDEMMELSVGDGHPHKWRPCQFVS